MLPKSLQKLIDEFAELPGIGRKTAQRLAYFLLRSHKNLAHEMGESLLKIRDAAKLCRQCCTVTDDELCSLCKNPRREKNLICVVENIFDAEAIERCGEYRGLYHILHGRLSPLDNISPEDLKIKELLARIKNETAQGGQMEIILATNPSSEGETTAIYLQRLLKPFGVKITRIATGIPVGADLEYADEVTLGRAMKGRQDYE